MSLIRLNTRPAARDLRVFGLCCVALLGFMGWSASRRGLPSVAVAAWVAGALVVLPGLIYPALLRPVYLLAIYVTFPIGFVLSYVILTAVYCLVFAPIGLLLRLGGKDPLTRRFDPQLKSYWTHRPDNASPASYFNQH